MKERMLFFLVGLVVCCMRPCRSCEDACVAVGVSNKNIIPDSSFTSTSQYNCGYAAHNARLNTPGSWEPKDNKNPNDFLQIDLGREYVICAVATQGDSRTFISEWTTEYKIATSISNRNWTTYPSDNSAMLFPGNVNKHTIVTNTLADPVKARFIRFIPTKYRIHKALRVEVYVTHDGDTRGPDNDGVCQDAGVGISAHQSIIPDSSITATSQFSRFWAAKNGRLYHHSAWSPHNNSNPDDYLQIDLGEVFVICAVATQGVHGHNEWTAEYKIDISIDGTLWNTCPDNNSTGLFRGNNDSDTVVKNVLDVPVYAKLIRFTPTKWKVWKSLRVEVYGQRPRDFSCNSMPVGVASVAKIPNNNIKSSSNYNASTLPFNGRLGYTAGSSWCAATSDSFPYLQIDLGSPYIICGVATQGDHQSDHWVQTYQIQTSTDGSKFEYYRNYWDLKGWGLNVTIKTFDGNTDSDTVVKTRLYGGGVGPYFRFKPKSNYGSATCMRTELYGVQQNTVCSQMSVGLSYSSLVPDQRFTASSYYNNTYRPSMARLLTSNTAWRPKTSSKAWLQVDLGHVVFVCALATQGDNAHAYVKKYKFLSNLDHVGWWYYKENGVAKEFLGNTNAKSVVTNALQTPIKVKFIRFYPTDFYIWPSMRVDVLGVSSACSGPFGVENGIANMTGRMTSSSEQDSAHTASHGRLYGNSSWCSMTSSNREYLQVDLGKLVTLTGIATQGDPVMDKKVNSYKLNYSLDGLEWTTYRDPLHYSEMVFPSLGNDMTVRWIINGVLEPVTTRYVRILPWRWKNAICMRVELFGCTYPMRPKVDNIINQNLKASPKSYVDLVCKVQGPLVQYVEWYSDGVNVTSLSGGMSRGANFVKSVLRVNYTTADDVYNTYQCSSKTGFVMCNKRYVCRAKYRQDNTFCDGVRNTAVQVKLDFLSAQPSLSLDKPLSNSVKVRWTYTVQPSEPSVVRYVIKWWNRFMTKTATVPGNTTSYTMYGLPGCTQYNVTIKAVSNLGDGAWSDSKTFKTDSAIPKVAVPVVTAVPRTSQTILVAWKVPRGVTCPTDGYKVTYSLTPGGEGQEVMVHGMSHTLDKLESNTVYYITVRVHDEKGYGPASSVLVVRTLGDGGKYGYSQSGKGSSSDPLIYIPITFAVVLAVLVLLLFIYIIKLRKKLDEKGPQVGRNPNAQGIAAPYIVDENESAVTSGEQIDMKPVTPHYETIHRDQPGSPPGTGSPPETDTRPPQDYQELSIDSHLERPRYEELNPATRAASSPSKNPFHVYKKTPYEKFN